MKYWIVPCKKSTFLIDAALKANKDEDKNTFVDWRQSYDFAVGDIVFVYEMYPKSQVSYRMEVVAVGLNFDEATDQEVFWKDKTLFYDGLGSHKYARFRLISILPDGFMTLVALKGHGFSKQIRGVMQIKDEQLLAFMNGENIGSAQSGNATDASDVEESSAFTEGTLHEVSCNRYERNREAREECITLKGYRCAVCGMDFESTYGDIGRGFIHVHHLVPISSIGETYQVNPATDLVPVCPNCHNMLHQKEPPYTIEELRSFIKNNR